MGIDDINISGTAIPAGVTITESGGNTAVTEGGATDSYSVVLNSQPTANVTVNINSGTQLTTNPNQLVFTPQNWNIAQTITATAVDDAVVEGNHIGTIQHTVISTDSNYDDITINAVTVSITDNDTAAVTITESGGNTAVTEGGATDSYSVVLNSQPTANVTVNINSGTQLTTNPNQLVFTPQNWNIAQTITATAVDDTVVEGNHTGTIQHTVISSDSNYNGINIGSVNVSITDNDIAAQPDLSVSITGSPNPVNVGDTLTYILTVNNTGNADANDVVVTYNLPSGVTYNNANVINGGFNFSFSGNTVTFSNGGITANGSATLEVNVIPNITGSLTSGTATVDPNNAITESDESNNVTNSITTTVNNVSPTINDISPQLINTNNDIFQINGGKANLKVTLTGSSSQLVNELGVFTVDDDAGTINGIAPGAAGYTETALERAQIIFSAIANVPNGFNIDNLTRLLAFNSSDRLRFYLINNSSTDAVITNLTPTTQVLFSTSSNQQITNLGANSFSLNWRNNSGSSTDFNDLVVKIQLTDAPLPLGINLQTTPQGELIDLRDISTQVKADFVVHREAAYNNFVGFYQITDANGGIDINGDGQADILTGQAGYIQAAIRQRVAGIDLTVNNQGTATYTGNFQPGAIFAPFMIVNGRPEALLDDNPNNDPAVYFPFIGANSDNTDHIRLLGNNTFGFEDLANGGDRDYNDIIVKINFSNTVYF
ncbi:DUF4114 domain-containing protein [Fortiea sp. LEGE XX443]|nr:DUF4114 domain-containing protein [Fortiea sp. LEGE XX443]